MSFFISKRTQLLAVFLAIGLLPGIGFSVFSLKVIKDAMIAQSLVQLETIRDIKSQQVEDYMMERDSDLVMLSVILGKVGEEKQGHVEIDKAHMAMAVNYFSEFIWAYGYAALYLLDTKGQVIHALDAQGNVHGQGEWAKDFSPALARLHGRIMKTRTRAFEDFSREPGEKAPHAFLGRPFVGPQGVESILALKLPVDGINLLVGSQDRVKRTMDVYIVGEDALLRSDSFLLPREYSVAASFAEPADHRIQTRPSESALGGQTGTMVAEDYRGERVLSAFKPISVLGRTWGVMAEVDEREVLAPLGRMFLTVGLVGLVVIGAVLWLSFVLSHRFSPPEVVGMDPDIMGPHC